MKYFFVKFNPQLLRTRLALFTYYLNHSKTVVFLMQLIWEKKLLSFMILCKQIFVHITWCMWIYVTRKYLLMVEFNWFYKKNTFLRLPERRNGLLKVIQQKTQLYILSKATEKIRIRINIEYWYSIKLKKFSTKRWTIIRGVNRIR